MSTILDLLQPQANEAAVNAANAALANVSARPFSVVLSVDDETKIWLTLLMIGGVIAAAWLKK